MNSDMYVDQCIPATHVDLYCNTLKIHTQKINEIRGIPILFFSFLQHKPASEFHLFIFPFQQARKSFVGICQP